MFMASLRAGSRPSATVEVAPMAGNVSPSDHHVDRTLLLQHASNRIRRSYDDGISDAVAEQRRQHDEDDDPSLADAAAAMLLAWIGRNVPTPLPSAAPSSGLRDDVRSGGRGEGNSITNVNATRRWSGPDGTTAALLTVAVHSPVEAVGDDGDAGHLFPSPSFGGGKQQQQPASPMSAVSQERKGELCSHAPLAVGPPSARPRPQDNEDDSAVNGSATGGATSPHQKALVAAAASPLVHSAAAPVSSVDVSLPPPPPRACRYVDAFTARVVPDIGMPRFCHRLKQMLRLDDTALICALVLLDRAVDGSPAAVAWRAGRPHHRHTEGNPCPNRVETVPLTEATVHRLLLAAVVIAFKARNDVLLPMKWFAHVGGVTTRDMAVLESVFLAFIDYDAGVCPAEFERMRRALYPDPKRRVGVLPTPLLLATTGSSSASSTTTPSFQSPTMAGRAHHQQVQREGASAPAIAMSVNRPVDTASTAIASSSSVLSVTATDRSAAESFDDAGQSLRSLSAAAAMPSQA